jgi:hypothetical protein
LATKLNLQTLDDWYKVQYRTVVKEGGSFINTYYNSSVIKGNSLYYNMYLDSIALQTLYPEHPWQRYSRITMSHTTKKQPGSKTQTLLFDTLYQMLIDTPIIQNYRVYPTSQPYKLGLKFYEFDVSFTI